MYNVWQCVWRRDATASLDNACAWALPVHNNSVEIKNIAFIKRNKYKGCTDRTRSQNLVKECINPEAKEYNNTKKHIRVIISREITTHKKNLEEIKDFI